VGLLLDLKGFEKCAALSGAAGLPQKKTLGYRILAIPGYGREQNCGSRPQARITKSEFAKLESFASSGGQSISEWIPKYY